MTFKEKYWHNLFQTGILVKAINGAWETISGLILLVVSNATLNSAYLFIFKDELIDDPHDIYVKHIATLYLIGHGLVNLILAYNLFKGRLKAYMISITFDFLLILYFIYLYIRGHSYVIVVFMAFNVIFIGLTWHEYKKNISKKGDLRLK